MQSHKPQRVTTEASELNGNDSLAGGVFTHTKDDILVDSLIKQYRPGKYLQSVNRNTIMDNIRVAIKKIAPITAGSSRPQTASMSALRSAPPEAPPDTFDKGNPSTKRSTEYLKRIYSPFHVKRTPGILPLVQDNKALTQTSMERGIMSMPQSHYDGFHSVSNVGREKSLHVIAVEHEPQKVELLQGKIKELTDEVNEYKRSRLLSLNADAQVFG